MSNRGIRLGVVCALACLLGACRSPPLRAANDGVAERGRAGQTPAPDTRISAARALAAPFLGTGDRAPADRSPYDTPLPAGAIDTVERARALRLEAYRPRPNPCGPVERARDMPPPDKNGSQATGGVPAGPLLSGLLKLLRGERLR
ncbi:MAG: hypothetical protein O2894_03370 [Planctomycetota bacterium]|nr:hypothetical protein [Planctomycetota bacterium]